MSSVIFYFKTNLYVMLASILTLSYSTFASANSTTIPNSCSVYLSKPTRSANITEQDYYLNLFFGAQNFRKLKDSVIKIMLNSVDEALAKTPNDINLINVYWYTSRLIDAKNRTLLIRQRRFELLQRLEQITGSSEDILYRYYQAYSDLKDHQTAFKYIFMLTRDFPDKLNYSIARIRTNLSLREFNRASNLAEDKLIEFPNNPHLLRLASRAFIGYARTKNANSLEAREFKISLFVKVENYLKRLFELETQGPRYHSYFVESLLGQKTREKYQEALNYLTYSRIAIHKNEVLYLTARAHLGLRDLDSAESVIQELLEIGPENKHYQRLKEWHTRLSNELNNLGESPEEYTSEDTDYDFNSFYKDDEDY